MKRALVISSQVAASAVGANNSAFCLRRLGVETVVLPTTLLGRHPGWGAPGGQETPASFLSDMWAGISAQNFKFDAVLTGYMGSTENVELAGKIIQSVKADNPDVVVIVDPVMGDHGKLYVAVDVAEAILHTLFSCANIITPNIWEFSHAFKRDIPNLTAVKESLQDYGGCALVTSVEHQGRIGALSYHPKGLTYIGHEMFEKVPNGGGDALAGTLLAHILNGHSEERAAQLAVSSIFQMMKTASDNQLKEFPLTDCQSLLEDAPVLSMDRLL